MDITNFVATKRDRALQVGDHNAYRKQLSRNLLSLRRKLGRTTPKNAKTGPKPLVTVEDVGKNHEFAHILLLQAERAWAHAMHIKSAHAEDNASKGISGHTRQLMLRKLRKAAGYAQHLTKLLSDRGASKATDNDFLEAKAYALSLLGAEEFECQVTKRFDDAAIQKEAWKKSLEHYSEAHIIYSALLFASQREVFREFIGGTIDPSIRYAAYQSKLPRTIAVGTVAKKNFPKGETEALSLVQKLNPNALTEETAQKVVTTDGEGTAPVPTAITWRKRTAPIVDAAIGQALAAASFAASKLSTNFHNSSSISKTDSKDLAAAYDPILNSAQDAVDAVRRCISDLSREGVAESDSRMQDLRVSDLAVNYGLISWRIGRNRVLIGGDAGDDGMTFSTEPSQQRLSRSKSESKTKTKTKTKSKTEKDIDVDGDTTMQETQPAKQESTSHRLARLTTRVVLLDSTLQSIDAIASLPGATRDVDFQSQLSSQRAYFQALKCLNIGYSYQAVASQSSTDMGQMQQRSALALFARASELLSHANDAIVNVPPTSTPGLLAPEGSPGAEGSPEGPSSEAEHPLTLLITPTSLSSLKTHISNLIFQQRGLVSLIEIQLSASANTPSTATATTTPLINNLHTFPPTGKIDLNNIVMYPPKLLPVPVKPIFLDIAWNYIKYPGEGKRGAGAGAGGIGGVDNAGAGNNAGARNDAEEEQEQEQGQRRRGWFGFGRS